MRIDPLCFGRQFHKVSVSGFQIILDLREGFEIMSVEFKIFIARLVFGRIQYSLAFDAGHAHPFVIIGYCPVILKYSHICFFNDQLPDPLHQ